MLDSTLLGIASELLVEILQHLDYLSLLRCQQTCLRLCRLIKLDSKLQYILELNIYRLQEHNISGPYSERLAYLRRYRQKWECLDFSKAVSVPTDPTSMAYDFAEGIYSQLMQSGDVVIHQIPSALDPSFVVQRRNIFRDTNRTFGIPDTSSPKDFAVDPSQNLIIWYERISQGVLGQLTFYFHCLDNIGVVHPEANRSTWVTDIDKRTISSLRHDTIVWMDAELRVFQDLLAIHIEVDSWPQDDKPVGIILIWNWKIGRVVFDSRVFPLARNPSKHALLGRDILLVTSVEDSGSLALYGFQPTSNHGYPRLLALFRFPPLQAWCTLSSTHVQTPHCCENATAAFKPVFHESIIGVTLTYLKEAAVLERASYSLFVHLSSLLSYITCGYERYVFWEDWGPKHTRLLPKITPGVWVK
ncbi:hypothetical protein BJ165DRAFT_177413 [Panaeolus papilionaceus]|nr:hypothetical protein BJ165DRAFT_177413 [Panaeolus papilionaceus]